MDRFQIIYTLGEGHEMGSIPFNKQMRRKLAYINHGQTF